jgi:hypothetical protein
MRYLLFWFAVIIVLSYSGCDTAISVIISNPAGGTVDSPKQLAPGEQLGVFIHEKADPATFKVTLHDPQTSDDACPYFFQVDITAAFGTIAPGTTVKGLPSGRMSVCGPFLMKAQAEFAEPPSAQKIFTTSETWITGWEARQIPPLGSEIRLKVNETTDVGVDFMKPAVGEFVATATVTGVDQPVVTVNNSLPEAKVTVAAGANSLRVQLKAVNKGECGLYIDLPGGPSYGKRIIVE